jgi:hypothetical protein
MYCDMRNIVQSPAQIGALESTQVRVALTWIKGSHLTCPDAAPKTICGTRAKAGEVATLQTAMR